jgi:signal transduction histidine kinase
MSLPAYIRDHVDEVVEEWHSFAVSLLPGSGQLSSLTLRDHARHILLAIAADVETSQSPEQSVAKSHGHRPQLSLVAETAAHIHGSMRQKLGFNISQLAAEYRALRSSVLRSWRAARVNLPTDEMMAARFHEAIDEALAESVARYSAEVEWGQNLFLGMIAHDIRTPLVAIAMSASAVKRMSADDERAVNSAERIERSVGTIETMVSDLLKFARIGPDAAMPLSRHGADMDQICHLAIDDVKAAHPLAVIDFESCGATPGTWDAHRLGQLLRNLLSNAVAYGEPDHVIQVSLARQDHYVSLAVANLGPAIPPESMARIFEPLVRLPPAHPAASAATHLGLGLYIVREIVAAHGGVVWVESETGKNTFCVNLPIEPNSARLTRPLPLNSLDASLGAKSSGGLRAQS